MEFAHLADLEKNALADLHEMRESPRFAKHTLADLHSIRESRRFAKIPSQIYMKFVNLADSQKYPRRFNEICESRRFAKSAFADLKKIPRRFTKVSAHVSGNLYQINRDLSMKSAGHVY